MTFSNLEIINPILKAIADQGYKNPTRIQAEAIPTLLKGKDLLGCAQTGTGKTAAFVIPLLQQLYLKKPKEKGKRILKALIISPTRELAIQINDDITNYSKYTGNKSIVIYGGVRQHKQTSALRTGADILVATPGRLLDLIKQGYVRLNKIEYFVLDEADQMLDMGFIHDIKKIITKLPTKRQSLFFSATMPEAIIELSKQILGNPKRVTIEPEKTTAEKVSQFLYYVSKSDKVDLLKYLINKKRNVSTLVFSRTKHGADKIVRFLQKSNIKSEAIHGNKSQNAREKTLQRFKKSKFSVLVATDIAARGIDVSKLSLVINYDIPNVPETYIHRIGRTGRAQEVGEAITFCSSSETSFLKNIQKLINQQIQLISDHPFHNQKNIDRLETRKDKKNPKKSRFSATKIKIRKKKAGNLKVDSKKHASKKFNFKRRFKRKES